LKAEQKKKIAKKTSVLKEEVAKTTAAVKIPEVGDVTEKIDAALELADGAREAVEVETEKTKMIRVCNTCGEEDCDAPDRYPKEHHWVDKEVPA